MSPNSYSHESHIPNAATGETGKTTRRPRQRWACLAGIGCLATVLATVACIAIAAAILLASGVLAGPRGNEDFTPSWSPDGQLIAFASNRHGNPDIYVMNTDGSRVVQLTRNPFARLDLLHSAWDGMPAWSPDSTHIVFASSRDNMAVSYVALNLYKMNIDGSNVVQLTGPGTIIGTEQSPAWSPDGSQIAFQSNASGIVSADIYVMNADGTNILQLTNDTADDGLPAWSPDGSQIAFQSNASGTTTKDIYVMNTDGTNILQLTNGTSDNGDPAWSPDGSRIAFESVRGDNVDVYVMNADGTSIMQLTANPGFDGEPTWSPDSRQIAFVSDQDGDFDIYVMDADGSNVIQLTGKSD